MRATILTLVFAVGTLPVGFAQTQSTTTQEKTQDHSATTVNPDGSAVHSSSKSYEKSNTSNDADGSTTTSKSATSESRTKVRRDVPADSSSTVEHHSESHSSSSTTSTNP